MLKNVKTLAGVNNYTYLCKTIEGNINTKKLVIMGNKTISEVKNEIKMFGIHRWIFEIPMKDVLTSEADTTINECCLLCGKETNGSSSYYVHLLTNGNLISSNEDFDNSQGFFPIGNECRKKLPNNFVFKCLNKN